MLNLKVQQTAANGGTYAEFTFDGNYSATGVQSAVYYFGLHFYCRSFSCAYCKKALSDNLICRIRRHTLYDCRLRHFSSFVRHALDRKREFVLGAFVDVDELRHNKLCSYLDMVE